MSDAIETISQALAADAYTLRTLAQNIANAQTTGYQRAVPVTHTFASLADPATSDHVLQTQQLRAPTDRTPGTLHQTQQELDLAIDGAGYFVVDTGSAVALSRRGDFGRDASGFLVTSDQSHVLGLKGAIQVGAAKVQVTATGEVKVNEQIVDRLRIVTVADGANLHGLRAGLMEAPEEELQDVADPVVRQGFLEGSNVESVNEMLRVMETLRHFETMQRYFRATDDLTQKAISELGKTGL